MPARTVWLAVAVSCLAPLACDEVPRAPDPVRPPVPPMGDLFDPDTAGSVGGVVRWEGESVRVAPFRSIDEPLIDPPVLPATERPNPNAPRIDAEGRTLDSGLVFLRGVDPRRARPWDHAPVRVELRGQRFQVVQGAFESNLGIVRVGDEASFLSREGRLHTVQGRGAAFFSLAIPRPERDRIRRFDAPGVVELLSGSGYYWMRAYLHVADHPYVARPDARGRFLLDGVPAGEYDLVAWHPSWKVEKSRRNPDIFRMQQVYYSPPIEAVRRVRVSAGTRTEVTCSLAAPAEPRTK